MHNHTALGEYLSFISEQYGLQIVVNDFINFIHLDSELAHTLRPYMIHSNAYCMMIKSNPQLWDRCLELKHHILRKCRTTQNIFWGMCHCGIGEYIMPIICHDTVIGAICIGVYCQNRDKATQRVQHTARRHNMDSALLLATFHQTVSTDIPASHTIKSLLGIVSDYMVKAYQQLQNHPQRVQAPNHNLYSNELYILHHIQEFIHQHYTQPIYVSDIAQFCHCSESYIHHIFKKNTGQNIRACINDHRMKLAKRLLVETTLSITEIAGQVGFNDPNYFSSLFQRRLGTSPTQWRRSNHAASGIEHK